METIRIGIVPEHYNAPIHQGIINGVFSKAGIDLKVTICQLGTGEMVKKLRANELDVIIALTEGLLYDLSLGNANYKISSLYTQSPLTWAVSTAPKSVINTLEDLDGGKFGISAQGSGSQIMCYKLEKEEFYEKPISFVKLGNFQALIDGIRKGFANAFLWEKYTTSPLYAKKELKYVGEITADWPAFMIAVRKEVLEKHKLIKFLHQKIYDVANTFVERADADFFISNKYNLSMQAATEWLERLEYAKNQEIPFDKIKNCYLFLKEKKLIDKKISLDDLLANSFDQATIIQ